VVTREELRNRLWPADTFVDFDHSLNAAIRRLRDALGDSAENPRFVETVARRGYRFLAPVRSGNGNGTALAPHTGTLPTPATAETLPRWWIAAAVAGILLLVLGVTLGLLLRPHAPTPMRFSQLTANPMDDRVRAAAISRDGRYLSFSDSTGFYIRQIDSGETHSIVLPQGLAPRSVGWFPDSIHMVAELAGSNQRSSLWEFSALGGNARELTDDGRFPAVSPDGKQVAFIAGKKLREELWLVNADGSSPHKLLGHEGDLFGAVAWSPDSTKIAYTRAQMAYGYGANAVIEIVEANGQQASSDLLHVISVLSLSGLDGPLAWSSDDHLIYSVLESRPRQQDSNLWSLTLDRQSKPVYPAVRLTNDHGSVFSISASIGGKRIVYLKGIPQPDVYIARLSGLSVVGEPQRLTLDDREDLPFDWTADGKAVLYMSDRNGTLSIYKQRVDQALPEVLVGGNRPVAQPRLNSDGTQLIYVIYSNLGDPVSPIPLMRVPLAGGAPQEIFSALWITNHQCSRGQNSICVASVMRDAELTFYTFDPFKGRGPQIFQIKDALPQLYNWSLSPDGKTLAIAKGKWGDEEPRIHFVPLNGGSDRWLNISGWSGLASLDWSSDGKGLWATTVGEEENSLLYIDLRGHAVQMWRPKKMSVGWAIPSRDGHHLALLVGSGSANVWMAERP